MRYSDWLAEYERLWAAVRLDEETWRKEHGIVRDPRGWYNATSEWGTLPSHPPLDALSKTMRREYKLSERAWIRVHPERGPREGFVAWSRCLNTDGDFWNTQPQPHSHTPAEHRAIADVIEHVLDWVAGRVDALRPSDPGADENGAWP